jgi:uncharacterized protein
LFLSKFIAYNLLLLLLLTAIPVKGQDSTVSLAYKKNRQNNRIMYFYQPDLAYQLWQQFNLMKKANEGDPLAQHELGLRYLLGQGIVADTIKGAYWVEKAASFKLAAACFNYGILLLNGWGVKWNPFKAFNNFMIAADDGMPAAEYIVGLIYTDNLIVKRNWSLAYTWVKKAADQDYKDAKEMLVELKSKIPASELHEQKDTTAYADKKTNNSTNRSFASSMGLVYIDFDSIGDTTQTVSDKMIIEDLRHEGNEKLADTLGIKDIKDSTLKIDKTRIDFLKRYADAGSPEALTLLGRMYEKGDYGFPKKSIVTASAYYVRATKLDNPRAPFLLYELGKNAGYFNYLKSLVDKNDPEAMFVWYGLHSLGFSNNITDGDAFNLLTKAAKKDYIPAIIELGLDYYTGKYVTTDKKKGMDLWEKALSLGSTEAKIRLITSRLFSGNDTSKVSDDLNFLEVAANDGSILAQAALANLYENGIGVKESIAEAVKYYRYAAQRGNRYAYNQLVRLYNSIRPNDPQFQTN